MIVLAVSAAIVVGFFAMFVTLALILPCPACQKRRQRMREAYAKWQAEKDSQH